jgi:hypothetical protein
MLLEFASPTVMLLASISLQMGAAGALCQLD